jgi:hypothetical protein
MWISKRAYEDLLRSHHREVEILTDWVRSLQMDQGAPSAPLRGPVPSTTLPDLAMYIGEEEDSLLEALANGLLDEAQFQSELAKLQARNHDVSLEVVPSG